MDRTSRYVRLVYLPYGHRAEAFHTALLPELGALPEYVRLTLTWDQGSEMALHERISEHFRDGVYFAYPASPLQRGTNENTNGLLRQYFPKGTSLSGVDDRALREVENRLNNRPRKVLGWRTPAEIFHGAVPT